MFRSHKENPPQHINTPRTSSSLLWAWAIKQRIQEPMSRMRRVCSHVLKGDSGWILRDAYNDLINDIENFEKDVIKDWEDRVGKELAERLREPLLRTDPFEDEELERPIMIFVNLDPSLLKLLREVKHLTSDPLALKIPRHIRHLVRDVDASELALTATRLHTIASKYNAAMRMLTPQTKSLMERTLTKIDRILDDGLHSYTWRTVQSADYIEDATSLVCHQFHDVLDIVESNYETVLEITTSWLKLTLDIFNEREAEAFRVDYLVTKQLQINESVRSSIVAGGMKIHSLLKESFEVIQISEASPAWQTYVEFIDGRVLEGLKKACNSSITAMINEFAMCCEPEKKEKPVISIRLELIDNQVAFRPPLDVATASKSVPETINSWVESFLERGSYVYMLSDREHTFEDFIRHDEELQRTIVLIKKMVRDNCDECSHLQVTFSQFSFLWMHDVHETFKDFLKGEIQPNIRREGSAKRVLSASSSVRLAARSTSSTSSIVESGLVGTGEQAFLSKNNPQVPSLDQFDTEIDIYRSTKDEISRISESDSIGFIEVDKRPIKQVLLTLASKWMWTFVSYLIDQVTAMLVELDDWLCKIEPEIEAISGEESDTNSFMKLMRLFNSVAAKQADMDAKFAAMHRTVLLVKKYGYHLPKATFDLFDAAPSRWASLKTKVSLAKQRLGPRIQQQSATITEDLNVFCEKLKNLQRDILNSDVYSRDIHYDDALKVVDRYIFYLLLNFWFNYLIFKSSIA